MAKSTIKTFATSSAEKLYIRNEELNERGKSGRPTMKGSQLVLKRLCMCVCQ